LVFWIVEACHFYKRFKISGIALSVLIIAIVSFSNISRSYETNKELRNNYEYFDGMRKSIAPYLQGKVLLVEDDALYNYLQFHQMDSKEYAIIFVGNSQLTPQAVLKSTKGYDSIKDNVLWTDIKSCNNLWCEWIR
jgi:hypothetical protein